MPTPQKSNAEHKINGSYRPSRHGDGHEITERLDPTPPDGLTAAQEAAWHELLEAGRDYLAPSDRVSVEFASRLWAAVKDGTAKAAQFGQLTAILTKLGMTPAGRRSVDKVKPDPTSNPFSEF